MTRVDVPVRAPTGGAWLAALAAVIVTGEVFYERSQAKTASFFGVPYRDDELLPVVIAGMLLAVVAAAWLGWLYARPGRLVIDEGSLSRRRRPFLRPARVTEAPLGSWRVRLIYFSAADRDRGAFKRLELETDGYREVLLYGDLASPDEVQRALLAASARLAKFEPHLERAELR